MYENFSLDSRLLMDLNSTSYKVMEEQTNFTGEWLIFWLLMELFSMYENFSWDSRLLMDLYSTSYKVMEEPTYLTGEWLIYLLELLL